MRCIPGKGRGEGGEVEKIRDGKGREGKGEIRWEGGR